MSPILECPVCGLAAQPTEESDGGNRKNVHCQRCGVFTITTAAARRAIIGGFAIQLSAWIRSRTEHGQCPPIISRENIDDIEKSLPRYSVSDKQRILLQAIERRTSYPGQDTILDRASDFPLAWASGTDEFHYLINALSDRGLIETAGLAGGNVLLITPSGWDYLNEVARTSPAGNQAFVAMWFSKKLTEAWQHGIKPALERAKFLPYRVDVDPHIDRIDAKIMTEIRNSRFLVADVTGQRQGVYFEAGYAMGLGLPVVWSVREDDLENVHFDTRQYNHIVWTDEDDLQEQLYNRVSAVIGRPND